MIEESHKSIDFITVYEIYCDGTRTGEHGNTGQFRYSNIEMMDLHLRFNAEPMTLIYHLSDMCDIFFATNR